MPTFLIDTDAKSNRGNSYHDKWFARGIAVTGGPPKFRKKLERINRGDTVLMYAKRIGVVAAGTVEKGEVVTVREKREIVSPSEDIEYHRKVEWHTDFRLTPISPKKLITLGVRPRQAVQRVEKGEKAILQLLRTHGTVRVGSFQRLPDNEAASNGYVPKDGDWRKFVERQVCQRRGQQKFRDALLRRYGERCLVTGCKVVAVLEAAHIRPYRGDNDDNEENGLLLRADIHTLFDLDLIAIDPDDLTLELHPQIAVAYGRFVGESLLCDPNTRPSVEPLRLRYEQFKRRLRKSN